MKVAERLTISGHELRAALAAELGPKLQFDRGLAEFTSFKTGGPARYFMPVQTAEELSRTVKTAQELALPFFILGGGSNLLVSDDGYEGLVIKMDIGGLRRIGATEIEAGAGEDLQALVDFATEHALSGLEFAAGIWGTVGGAIYGNAGAFGSDVGSIVSLITMVGTD
ncbi:MAG TPA: FAD-binding protein, partial [Candidatus Deferrimicrobium sp.]|nr:FAD-binding protein [Candidatus Deferrimicrobium sp.]